MSISIEQINHFKRHGWVTVSIFSPDEIVQIRAKYHSWLLKFGVKAKKLSKDMHSNLPCGNTQHINCYYQPFKLEMSLNHRIWQCMSDLWGETFATNQIGFEHDFGDFDPSEGLVHFDRACFRFPNSIIKDSKGLNLHIDKNPHTPPSEYWRPIQMSLALVDHDGNGNDGGLGVIPGFHLKFDEYFQDNPVDNKRQFVILKQSKHPALWDQIEFIIHSAGSIVLWDNRLPHCTAPNNLRPSGEAREVFFSSFLPNIYLNTSYVSNQLQSFKLNQIPPLFREVNKKYNKNTLNNKTALNKTALNKSKSLLSIHSADANPFETYNFSLLQLKLLGEISWSD